MSVINLILSVTLGSLYIKATDSVVVKGELN